ncbi:hypothetical protein D3C71_1525100 [compost metagenome]
MTESVDNGKIRGAVMVDLEGRGDRGLIDNLKRAEAKFGMKTGARFLDGKEGVISYLGYPTPRFYFQKRRMDGSFEDAIELTKEKYDQTYALKL